MDSRVELKVLGITYSQVQKGAYALLLSQVDGPYRIPVVVGVAEAQSIAMKLENIIPPRPMSHDLMVSLFHAFGISLEQVFIYKFHDGTFLSELTLKGKDAEITLDSRTSDAIALAVRTDARIFTTQEILQETGFIVDKDDEANSASTTVPDEPSLEQLKKRLAYYVEKEEYERAAKIKKIIDDRTGNAKN
jgi:bifunctional DNase/RNase